MRTSAQNPSQKNSTNRLDNAESSHDPSSPKKSDQEFDFLIIGSGFGGSVAALRLSQKGYRVGVIEAGRRWRSEDFPKTNWNIRKFFWFPKLRLFGFQTMTLVRGVLLLHGAGVGGGSLVYANTLMAPADDVFNDPAWPKGVSWTTVLRQRFETARKSLGVVINKELHAAEEALLRLGKRLGVESTFHPTHVGVHFGTPGVEVSDPYFQGEGPRRKGCTLCGGCMVGCRENAKNTLDKNYLFFAEKWGTQIFAETQADRIVPLPNGLGFEVQVRSSTRFFSNAKQTIRARKVIVAAGVLGTLKLLFRNRDQFKTLPLISPCLGRNVRTNGESLVGITELSAKSDFSKGIAIGAAIHPDSHTKIEAVKYPAKSTIMAALSVPLTTHKPPWPRPLLLLLRSLMSLPTLLRLPFIHDWAKQSIILLVMQTIDRKIHLTLGRSPWTLFRNGLQKAPHSDTIPSYLPVAQRAVQELATDLRAFPQNATPEVLLGTPTTAHILGGAAMGNSSDQGVIDPNHEVFGHPGLYVCDGSVIPVNLGVNPSLTIAALAERFASQFPRSSSLTESEFERRCQIFPA